MSDTNILSEKKLSVRRLTGAKIYTHAGVLDVIGRRGWGAYLDSKTEAWPAPNCTSTVAQSCACCGSDGYTCYSCTIYVTSYGGSVPSASFNSSNTFGYKDGNNNGFKSFAISGVNGLYYAPSYSTCTTCAGATEATVISAQGDMGDYAYAGIKEADGTLWAWGYNGYGQVGDSTQTSRNSPIQLGSNSWKMISGGVNYFFAAIRNDGTLWTWGYNGYGQLGVGSTTNYSSPVQVAGTWDYVQCGGYGTAAIRNDGTLWTWGYNAYGHLGDNTTTSRSSPVQVSGGGTWKAVHMDGYNCHAIKTDGRMYGWGYNNYYAVGDGTVSNRSSPVQIGTAFSDWTSVRIGYAYHNAYAIRSNGTMYAWGNGPLGIGGLTQTPTQIGTSTNHLKFHKGVTYLATMNNSFAFFMPFITNNGGVSSYASYGSTQTSRYTGGGATELVFGNNYAAGNTYGSATGVLIKYVEKT